MQRVQTLDALLRARAQLAVARGGEPGRQVHGEDVARGGADDAAHALLADLLHRVEELGDLRARVQVREEAAEDRGVARGHADRVDGAFLGRW